MGKNNKIIIKSKLATASNAVKVKFR